MKKLNRFDYAIIITIVSLTYGFHNVLGAVTPIRIVGLLSIYWVIKYKKELKNSDFAKWAKLLFFWLFYALLSIVWTPDQNNGIVYIIHFAMMILCILQLFISSQKAQYPHISFMIGWTLFLSLTLPIALWEITSGLHLSSGSFNDGQYYEKGVNKIFAAVTFQNYNSYTLLCTCALPFLIMLILNCRIFIIKVLLYVLLFFTSLVIIINSSRMGIICLITGLVLFLYFKNKKIKGGHKLLFIIIAFFICWSLITYFENQGYFSQLIYRLSNKSSFFEDKSRLMLWSEGIKISALDLNCLGGGIYSMQSLFKNYSSYYIYFAHNFIIEIFMEFGLVISIIFTLFLTKSIVRLKESNILLRKYLFYYLLIVFAFQITIDDYYFVRSGFWIYIASIISFSQMSHNITENK